MDSPVSAFLMYQKRNKNKRKGQPEAKTKQSIPTIPSKKSKKKDIGDDKPRPQNGFSALCKQGKKKNKVKSNRKDKNSKLVSNENTPSDDEIPTLVPISVDDIDAKNVKAKKTNRSISKSNSSKTNQEVKPTSLEVGNSTTVSVFNPVTQGLAIFKWLIDPITPKDFFAKYWEKDALHVKHSKTSYFEDIFSTDKLDSILREYPLNYTRNVDVVAYENNKKEVLNPEGRAVPSQLWDYYMNGCSIRVLNPQTYDQNVHSIISSLQEYFGTMVGANVYLTPPGSQGFAPHFDDIEAFIIQLEGSKHWKLYKPRDPDVLARDSSKNFMPEEIGKPFMEVTLQAGDLLYFPRGTIHEGRTGEDAHSLHITVSVYQHTAYAALLEHLLPQALKNAASKNIEYRKGLPLNYLKHVGVINQNEKSTKRQLIIDKTKSLVESLVNYMDIDLAADNLGRKFMHDAMPPLYSQEEAQYSSKFDGDHMKGGKVYNRVEINPDVKVRLLRYYAVRVVKENEINSKLYYCTDNAKVYHGEEEQWLEIANTLIPAFEMLQKSYPEFVEVDKLPVEIESDKLQLVSDLWERGLLVTDGPLPQSCFDSDTDSDSDSDTSSEEYMLVESDSE